jgi:hypothetical protein
VSVAYSIQLSWKIADALYVNEKPMATVSQSKGLRGMILIAAHCTSVDCASRQIISHPRHCRKALWALPWPLEDEWRKVNSGDS